MYTIIWFISFKLWVSADVYSLKSSVCGIWWGRRPVQKYGCNVLYCLKIRTLR